MDLNLLWFSLICILYVGYFFLEGFDFGVGILLPFLGKSDTERRAVINTIGPHWDGNEVWLLTAGGATFAAFPHWYASLFSGFYPAFFLLLVALILRNVSLEFRSKDANPKWRALWDWATFTGSLLAALLLGVAFANLAKGVPLNADWVYTGTLWTLLNPYGLVGGLSAIGIFALSGALFLSLKVGEPLASRAQAVARKLWPPVAIVLLALLALTFVYTDLISHAASWMVAVPILAFVALLVAGYFLVRRRFGWAFVFTGLTIALAVASCFAVMFPRVIISSTNAANSLDIYNAASGQYTLKVMTIVALIFVPVVLAYQGWTYWVFRKRVKVKADELIY
jgi:cytochrome d ubiquinol oxidase subunit II